MTQLEEMWENKLSIVTRPNSGLLEVTTKAFFGGYDIMQTREDLEESSVKLSRFVCKHKSTYEKVTGLNQNIRK